MRGTRHMKLYDYPVVLVSSVLLLIDQAARTGHTVPKISSVFAKGSGQKVPLWEWAGKPFSIQLIPKSVISFVRKEQMLCGGVG